ncbi:Hypp1587 [Branchiostoma lanceolatum]|uniref:Hypp1587 protein n=1 Tax=Branchiostoma lanceolatum TaxID=7740 RepID=A0A8K0EJZ7_BRALA|nr:Hypp1587 [Branchiostoma lanceolatum]
MITSTTILSVFFPLQNSRKAHGAPGTTSAHRSAAQRQRGTGQQHKTGSTGNEQQLDKEISYVVMTSLQTILLLTLVCSVLFVSTSHGLYPFRPEDRRDETLSELPTYDDLSDWADMLLEKERPAERGSTDWLTRLSDNSPPPLNLKDLVVGKSRRFWNTPMGSSNKGQPMALNLQTNSGRLPLGDLMKSKGPMGPLTWLTGGSSRPMPVGKLLKGFK